MESNSPFKIIELEDECKSNTYEYPYILSIGSKIRFRLRSKLCYDHTPVLLIEKLQSFDYILPLKQNIDIKSHKTDENFIILGGKITEDGAWESDLPSFAAGVISFQLVFMQFGSHMTSRFGTYDAILLCQDKHDIRKLRSQTVFPRCIGPVGQWLNFFRGQNAIGYNTFHLAPIQQTGASNSYYSLKSHVELSNFLFSGSKQQKNAQLASVLQALKKEGMVFFIDIILNHTSFDSEWIQSEPEAVFTVENTPMLYPAFLVDTVIYQWGEEVKEMMSFDMQLTEEILEQIQTNLASRLQDLQLYEFFQLSPDLRDILLASVPVRKPSDNIFAKDPIELIEQFLEGSCSIANTERRGVTVSNLQKWIEIGIAYQQNDLKLALEAYNSKWKNRVEFEWIPQILRNTMGFIKYHYIDNSNRSFDDPYPLVHRYFSRVEGVDGEFYAINNGWVGGHNDSRQLFVTSKEHHYLRRTVNAWGDLIRIRYGDKPSDSPAAWDHMLNYVREMAKYFDGFRMDNLHGTPLYVARHMIREARKVNPDLIVFAELFTGSDAETAEFVRQIGINSTLKQSQHLLNGNGFVHAFHHRVNFASPYLGALNRLFVQNGETVKYATRKQPIALVYDLTHDNETYHIKNKLVLQTPVAMLISFIGTFTGSTKGFDQFYSKKISVTELRELYREDASYPPVVENAQVQPYLITFKHKSPCELYGNWNHWKEGAKMTYHKDSDTYYTSLFLESGDYEYKFKSQGEWALDKSKPSNERGNNVLKVIPTYHPRTLYRNLEAMRKYISQTVCKFHHFKEYHVWNIGDIVIVIREPVDHLESICIIANLSTQETTLPSEIGLVGSITDCDLWLQSELSVYEGLTMQTQICWSKNIHEFFQVSTNKETGNDELRAPFLPPGFSCFIHCKKNAFHREMINSIEEILSKPIPLPLLGPLEINGLFFSCSIEEENLWGHSSYVIPQDGNHQLVYAGFAGVFQTILRAKKTKSLNEGLFNNLREGNWLMDYYLNRCRRYKHLGEFVEYLQKVFGIIGSLPRYLVPRYFSEFIYSLMLTVKDQTKRKTDFEKSLVLAANQFINYFPTCALPDKTLLAAGLPHFAVGWARCWGRDTFTSTDILRLYPNIFRESIVQFASTLRHGLIPNLLDEGRRPRFNCRDACWWFIRAIGEYIETTNDYDILKNKIEMIFYSNDKTEHERRQQAGEKKRVMLLQEIVQEIFQSHASGIFFREWNAGYEIDANMTTEGFNIGLEVDPETGFIIGGNSNNCLTWMDKMGSSTHAGTKGVPATPRAGAPVELVGLLYRCLRICQSWHQSGHYSYDGILFQGKQVSFKKWAELIHKNFENFFFLKEKSLEDIEPGTNVRGIYKDLSHAPYHFSELRFRPNALITLAVSPELCEPAHARTYIHKVEEYLIRSKSIGVGTLADTHHHYSPFYDNSDNSSDAKIAHGFSYHNGPEWVWLYGFYLVAKINFQKKHLTKKRMMILLQNHIKYLYQSEWQSLCELTNRYGEMNRFSCKAQAWSISSILMAVRRIQNLPDDQ